MFNHHLAMCLDNINSKISYTKFFGLIVANTLSWKPHIDHLRNKLNTASCVIRSVNPYVKKILL